MIKQHYYTKSKRGLYCSTHGYDTVAKNEGLSDVFIKNYLHELCVNEISIAHAEIKDSTSLLHR